MSRFALLLMLAGASACSRTPDGSLCHGNVRTVVLYGADIPVRRWEDACVAPGPVDGCASFWTKDSGNVVICGTFAVIEKTGKSDR